MIKIQNVKVIKTNLARRVDDKAKKQYNLEMHSKHKF